MISSSAAARFVARVASATVASVEAFAIAVSRQCPCVASSSSSAATFASSARLATRKSTFLAIVLTPRDLGGPAASFARRSVASCPLTIRSFSSSTATPLERQRRHQHSDAAAASTASSSQQREDLRLTPAAVERVRFLLEKREAKKSVEEGEEAFAILRLTVEAGGCSGFSYVFSLDDAGPRRGDRVFCEQGQVHGEERVDVSLDDPWRPLLAVDPVSFDLVKGATIDFEQELIKAGFEVVDNPNAEAGCGCGSSFAVKSA